MTSEDPGLEVVVFVNARLDEEERDARAAPKGPWVWEAVGTSGYPQRVTNATATLIAQCYENPDLPATCAEHIARQDPAATLARCAALRALLAPHTPIDGGVFDNPVRECRSCRCWPKPALRFPCPTWRHVAAIWRVGSDGKQHPDWRDEWAVSD